MNIIKKYAKYFIILLSILAFFIAICFIPINASGLIPSIEKQVFNDYGVKINIERLILRVGPQIKLKAPIIHLMYEDGQKFAQLNNIKFYVSWFSIFKNEQTITKLKAKKITIRVNSDDKDLALLKEKYISRKYSDLPSLSINDYSITYNDKLKNDSYILRGHSLNLNKINNYKAFKILTNGNFSINSKQYLTYDITIFPKFNLDSISNLNIDINNLIEHIKELDFCADIITDLKLYKTNEKLQASGFINIDNISVLDPTKRNPKSFVYLTLWGDKASILSNIYTSVDKKIYLEGMVNNSNKPVVDIKVKTDDINLNDLYKKLKIVSNFSRYKGVKSLEGNLNANFVIKGDLNKIKSNGHIKITDAKINATGMQIERINSEIDLSNNIINIVNAVGYVKDAPILVKGKFDKNLDIELLMNKVNLRYLFPESLGIQRGTASLVANITGPIDKINHKENFYIEDFYLKNDQIELAFDDLKYDTNKSNNALITNITCISPYANLIKIPSVKLIINDDSITVPDTNIFMQNSKLVFKADIMNYLNNNLTFNALLTGFVNSRDIKKLENQSTRYPLNINLNGNKFNQNLFVQLLLEKTDIFDDPSVINLSSKIEKKGIKIEDLSLTSFFGTFSNDFKSNLKGVKKLQIVGAVEDLQNPVLKNLRIFIPQILNIKIYDLMAQIKGDLFLNGNIDSPEIVGQITINNLYNQTLQLSLSNCILDFAKNIININAPQVKFVDSSLSLNAIAHTDIKKGVKIKNVNIKSKYLNTDTLLMYKDSPAISSIPLDVLDGKIYSERLFLSLYGEQIFLNAFSSDFNLINNRLNLKNISSEVFNGKVSGSFNFNLKDEHFNSQIMTRGASASSILNLISPRKESISGMMDFDSNLSGNISSRDSLAGKIKFIVNNGRMSSLGKLEHLLYAQNVVADNMLRTSLSVVTKAITLKDTGLFKYLRGEIDLEKGIANIKMLQSQGPLMSLYIKGIYNPINNNAALTVLGRLSDEVVTGLGAFGDFSLNKLMIMLTGEESKNNITNTDLEMLPQLPAKNTKEFRSIINGNIDKPSSVIMFNWISYSEKSLKQREVPMNNISLPSFIENLPY